MANPLGGIGEVVALQNCQRQFRLRTSDDECQSKQANPLGGMAKLRSNFDEVKILSESEAI
jgi:hypothetical protein